MGDMTTNLDEKKEEPMTPRSKMGSNIVNNTPREIGFSHSIRHKDPRNN
jgi:hypothetical protein